MCDVTFPSFAEERPLNFVAVFVSSLFVVLPSSNQSNQSNQSTIISNQSSIRSMQSRHTSGVGECDPVKLINRFTSTVQPTKPPHNIMCKPSEIDSKRGKFTYISVLLPIFAGILHLRVFFVSLFTLASSSTPISTDIMREKAMALDIAVFFAYNFDLICCYVFKNIPFSRCNSSGEIAGHHLPILVALLPLSMPMYLPSLSHINPLVTNILQYNKDGGTLREGLIDGNFRANGWGFLSSFNEVCMCFQRAEMNLQGVKTFREIKSSKMKIKIFSSRLMVGVELYFKLCIFFVFSIFAFRACCGLDMVMYQYLTEVHENMTLLQKISNIGVCPLFIRSTIYRIFLLVMYPTMGLRTAKKIRTFHREGYDNVKGGIEAKIALKQRNPAIKK